MPDQAPDLAPDQDTVGALSGANLPVLSRPPSRRGSAVAWALLVLLIGVFAGGLVARHDIIAAWPSAARLYERLGLASPGYEAVLTVRNASSTYQEEDGKPVLVVQGEVVNISNTLQAVPNLRTSLRENGREVQSWIFQAAQSRLLPGEAASFVTRFKDPSPSATELTITFTDQP